MTTSRHMTTSPRRDTAAVLGVWLIVQGGMQTQGPDRRPAPGPGAVITGEIPEPEQKGRRHRRSRRTGRFEFHTYLPGDVNADGVTAAVRRATEADHSEVRGGQAAPHRNQGLTNPAAGRGSDRR